ncbi:FtsW/RodA/SpoVE family cell cycle protein [Rugosimonospora acidiphila]
MRSGPLAALRGVLARPLASYYLLLSSSGLLLVIGLVMVFSATSVQSYADGGNAYQQVTRQTLYALIGLVAFWIFQRLPVDTYRSLGKPLLIVSIALLALLDLLSLASRIGVLSSPGIGPLLHADELNSNWLYIGPLQMQPSELAKLALTLWGAGVLEAKGAAVAHWRQLARPLFPVAAVIVLMVGINDLGTTLCLMILFLGLLWAAGVRWRVFAGLGALGLAAVTVLILTVSYRVARITTFAGHGSASAQDSTGYQGLHGLYAIADGGWFGVGLGESRLKWGWLPNAHNDFIFAIIAEELGVVGCFVVLGLLAVLAYTGLRIARRSSDPFRRMVAAAITVWLVGQATINIGGVVGLLPITGLPLPFISAGGTALIVTLAAVGLLASFARAEPDAARALHARPSDRWVRLLWAPLPPLPRSRRAARKRTVKNAVRRGAKNGVG